MINISHCLFTLYLEYLERGFGCYFSLAKVLTMSFFCRKLTGTASCLDSIPSTVPLFCAKLLKRTPFGELALTNLYLCWDKLGVAAKPSLRSTFACLGLSSFRSRSSTSLLKLVLLRESLLLYPGLLLRHLLMFESTE